MAGPWAWKKITEDLAHAGTELRVPEVVRVLGCLREPCTYWELLERTDLPLPHLSALLRYLEREGHLQREDNRFVLRADSPLAEGASSPEDRPCPRCGGTAQDLSFWLPLKEALKERLKERPQPERAWDQAYVTLDSLVARVALMDARGDLEGRKIFILGDDDMLSLALALTGKPARVLAVDADPRIVAFLQAQSVSNLEAERYDARDPLPEEWVQQFEVFETDPVEAEAGFRLFLDRCLTALHPDWGAGYFGLTHRESSLAKWHRLQEYLLSRGLVITELLHDFNAYEPWPYHDETPAARLAGPAPREPWYRSCWYRVERVRVVEPENQPARESAEAIYHDAEATTR